MDPVFEVDVSGVDGQAVVGFLGELDLAAVTQAHDQVRDVLDQFPDGPLILDLGRLTYTDSSGIHVLLRVQGETRDRGREMILRHVPRPVAMVLDVAGVRDQFVIEDLTADAE